MLPTDSADRKKYPVTRGVLEYFPDAIAAVANVSFVGNEKHNKGEPLHWAREKSNDHSDCIARHLLEQGKIDKDGLRHTACLAWRALALLQIELEKAALADYELKQDLTGELTPFTDVTVDPTYGGVPVSYVPQLDTLDLPTVYIAGPMRGKPFYNFPAFDAARDAGIELGYHVISPADIDRENGIDLSTPEAKVGEYTTASAGEMKDIIKRDVDAIMGLDPERGDGIVCLPGWTGSTGAPPEILLARWRGLKLMDANYELIEIDTTFIAVRHAPDPAEIGY